MPLHPKIKNCLKGLGSKKPTDIQKLAIPQILKRKKCPSNRPTGIGKTEAALLPIFHRFLEESPKAISILYITPLKALNRDLLNRLLWWSEKPDIRVAVGHGDHNPVHAEKAGAFPS